MIERMCRTCGRTFPSYNTLDTKCGKCRGGMKQSSSLQQHKPMNKKGKVAKNWDKDRAKWLKDTNTGNDTWHCIVGGARLTDNKLLMEYGYLPITVDHETSRSRDQSKRREQQNFGAMCNKHNTDKGSRSLAEYLASSPDMPCG